MRLVDRFRRRPGPRPSGPLIRIPVPQPKVVEEFAPEQAGGFINAVHQAETIRRNAASRVDRKQRVEVWIQVSADDKRWDDAELFWGGYWEEGSVRLPKKEDLADVGHQLGMRYVRFVVRTIV